MRTISRFHFILLRRLLLWLSRFEWLFEYRCGYLLWINPQRLNTTNLRNCYVYFPSFTIVPGSAVEMNILWNWGWGEMIRGIEISYQSTDIAGIWEYSNNSFSIALFYRYGYISLREWIKLKMKFCGKKKYRKLRHGDICRSVIRQMRPVHLSIMPTHGNLCSSSRSKTKRKSTRKGYFLHRRRQSNTIIYRYLSIWERKSIDYEIWDGPFNVSNRGIYFVNNEKRLLNRYTNDTSLVWDNDLSYFLLKNFHSDLFGIVNSLLS